MMATIVTQIVKRPSLRRPALRMKLLRKSTLVAKWRSFSKAGAEGLEENALGHILKVLPFSFFCMSIVLKLKLYKIFYGLIYAFLLEDTENI